MPLAPAAVLSLLLVLGCAPARQAEGCVAPSPAATREDVRRAEQACSQARDRWSALFGVPAPALRLRLDTAARVRAEGAGADRVLVWPAEATLRRLAGELGMTSREADAFVERQWRDVLPHEMGHQMLSVHLYPGRVEFPGEYATPLPDWLDEGTAAWMESDGLRAGRRARLGSEAPPLRDVLSAAHPQSAAFARGTAEGWSRTVTETFPCMADCPVGAGLTTLRVVRRVAPDGRVRSDTTRIPGRPPAAPAVDALFYESSLAALEYLRERGGADAVRALAERLRDDPAVAPLANLPGMPGDAAALERGWREWLAGSGAPRRR